MELEAELIAVGLVLVPLGVQLVDDAVVDGPLVGSTGGLEEGDLRLVEHGVTVRIDGLEQLVVNGRGLKESVEERQQAIEVKGCIEGPSGRVSEVANRLTGLEAQFDSDSVDSWVFGSGERRLLLWADQAGTATSCVGELSRK